ncbi:MAG: PepF/M3 family oligoendopeptidase [Candidatus Woesebacteria bacterium GW2011_GWA1_37_8]|uniref:PepF/M3 family oligoendopeptidase n=1 Tax=Candidatus Woesebacteria bacterium GW2011_GWA1_37_8 TaxID=1618546 RepID=A0A0G0HXW8_9BACT|nr:MAG: PepF/M3 family oligoendopeptidase [Candidatus Woesebacteria bacterium GW2011_GWA1_37_8]
MLVLLGILAGFEISYNTLMQTSWNLGYLFKSDNDPKIKVAEKKSIDETKKFVEKWSSREDFLKDPKILKTALDEYEIWNKKFGANSTENYYFHLRESLDESNPKIKAKVNIADELHTKLQNEIQFFELKLSKINIDIQKKFLSDKDLLPYKHFLERLFRIGKFTLSDPEEKIMNLKSITSYDNWVRMTSSFLGKEERESLDEDGKIKLKNFSELTGLMNSKNKKIRDIAAKNFNEILEKHLDVAENELNSILQNKKVNDEVRGYSRPDEERHVADDLDSAVVDSLVSVVSKNFEVAKRFYALKAKLMGVKKLEYHERNVEVGDINIKYDFNNGYKIIGSTLKNLDTEFFNIFEKFVSGRRVDVYPKKGKTSGAFCSYGLITHPTYILLNWNDKLNDVLTFAHELGHGINDELIKAKQNALNFGTPTSTAEVASTFMEDFALGKLLKNADDKTKLAIYMMKLNGDVSTIFRQIAFYNFEKELHTEFRKTGYLSKVDIGKLFQKHMVSYMGGAVEQSQGSQNWWVYVSHFRYYFYVYSYAGGLLISKSLQSQVKKYPEALSKVKEFLSTGLSDSPKNIFMKLGIDISDANFWQQGISEVEKLLSETEELSKRVNL